VASPVSNDGRGLKQAVQPAGCGDQPASPVSNDGRGLKQQQYDAAMRRFLRRPSAMTGVD